MCLSFAISSQLVFMVMSSLKPDQQLLTDTESFRAFLPVGDISLDNYYATFKRAPVGLFVFNSIFVTGVTVLSSLFLCSLAAFSFVFLEWRGILRFTWRPAFWGERD